MDRLTWLSALKIFGRPRGHLTSGTLKINWPQATLKFFRPQNTLKFFGLEHFEIFRPRNTLKIFGLKPNFENFCVDLRQISPCCKFNFVWSLDHLYSILRIVWTHLGNFLFVDVPHSTNAEDVFRFEKDLHHNDARLSGFPWGARMNLIPGKSTSPWAGKIF